MSFEEILHHATTDALIYVDDHEFNVAGIEKVKLANGDHVIWMWSSEGDWLIIDQHSDELMFLHRVEDEVTLEDDYVTYLGGNYEVAEEDQGAVEEVSGETEHEIKDAFEVKHLEGEKGAVMRGLTWIGYGEELWYCGKMLEEDDVHVS